MLLTKQPMARPFVLASIVPKATQIGIWTKKGAIQKALLAHLLWTITSYWRWTDQLENHLVFPIQPSGTIGAQAHFVARGGQPGCGQRKTGIPSWNAIWFNRPSTFTYLLELNNIFTKVNIPFYISSNYSLPESYVKSSDGFCWLNICLYSMKK